MPVSRRLCVQEQRLRNTSEAGSPSTPRRRPCVAKQARTVQSVRVSATLTNGETRTPPGRVRGVAGRHKVTTVAVAVSVGFLVVNLVLALGQWDRDRVTFPAATGLEVSLKPGEQRIIYMTADESGVLNFDFYPSDFDCSARGPDGAVAVRTIDHRRLLNLWGRHWSVGSMVADEAGRYWISCSGHGDAPLVLAAPARFTVGWASPVLAVVILVGVLLGSALVQTSIGLLRRLRAGRIRVST